MQVVRHFHGQKYVTAENAAIRNRGDAYDSNQFCVVPFLVTHRIICGPSAIPDNCCLTECILSVKTHLLTDKLLILNNLSVNPRLFTDKLSILSQPYSVIRIIVASRTASHRKKLNIHADSPKLGIAEQRHRPLISIPLTPFSRGHIGACGLSIAAQLPCPPTPARHLMMPCCSF